MVSVSDLPGDPTEWVHASMRWRDRVPTYEQLTWLHEAVFGDGWAYQLFTPRADHINIHEAVCHLWGRLDGKPVMPNFGGIFGSI
jgi:hypothetical protein